MLNNSLCLCVAISAQVAVHRECNRQRHERTESDPEQRQEDVLRGGAIAIGINNYSPDLHDDFLRRLLSVANRASYDAGYSPVLAH